MTILHTTSEPENGAKPSEVSGKSRSNQGNGPSYVVKRKISDVKKRSAPHPEIAILEAATSYLEKAFEKQTVFITVEAHDVSEREARNLFRKVKSDISQMQARAGVPKFLVEVLEAKHSVHSHLIAVLPLKVAKRLENYSYGDSISKKGVVAVYDMDGLRDYVLKEIVKPSPKPLGEGSGSRVRLSTALKAALVAEGVMPSDYKRSYASRALKPLKPITMAPVVEAIIVPPPPSPSPARGPKDPEQVELFPDLPPPVSLIYLVEATRQALGLPQRVVASDIGITQGHYANSLRGHDALGPEARRNALAWISRHGFPRNGTAPPTATFFRKHPALKPLGCFRRIESPPRMNVNKIVSRQHGGRLTT